MFVEEQLMMNSDVASFLPIPTPGTCLEVNDIEKRLAFRPLNLQDHVDEALELQVDFVGPIDLLIERILVVYDDSFSQFFQVVDVLEYPAACREILINLVRTNFRLGRKRLQSIMLEHDLDLEDNLCTGYVKTLGGVARFQKLDRSMDSSAKTEIDSFGLLF